MHARGPNAYPSGAPDSLDPSIHLLLDKILAQSSSSGDENSHGHADAQAALNSDMGGKLPQLN